MGTRGQRGFLTIQWKFALEEPLNRALRLKSLCAIFDDKVLASNKCFQCSLLWSRSKIYALQTNSLLTSIQNIRFHSVQLQLIELLTKYRFKHTETCNNKDNIGNSVKICTTSALFWTKNRDLLIDFVERQLN